MTEYAEQPAFMLRERIGLGFDYVELVWRDGTKDPRLRFVKQQCDGSRVACFKIDFRPEKFFRMKTTFSKRDRETAFAAIMGAFYHAFANQCAHCILDLNFVRQINTWRRANFQAVTNLEIT